MNIYPISKEHKTHELQYIRTILHNNNYQQQTYQNIKTKIKNNNRTPDTPQKQKFATFTYIGTETRSITNLLKKPTYR
jgi:hypothetical protein